MNPIPKDLKRFHQGSFKDYVEFQLNKLIENHKD